MSSHGIRDQVAIVGMGCTNFGEHWDRGRDDLIIDAASEAFASAGVSKDDVDAYWLGTAQSGMSGLTLSRPLQLVNSPYRGSKTTARPVPKPSGQPPTRWHREATTWRWRLGPRRLRTADTKG